MAPSVNDAIRDNMKKEANRLSYEQFDRKVEKHFQSHPELHAGRDFRMNTMRYQVSSHRIADRFDQTFAGAPDSPEWWDKQFCKRCGRRHSLCRCAK